MFCTPVRRKSKSGAKHVCQRVVFCWLRGTNDKLQLGACIDSNHQIRIPHQQATIMASQAGVPPLGVNMQCVASKQHDPVVCLGFVLPYLSREEAASGLGSTCRALRNEVSAWHKWVRVHAVHPSRRHSAATANAALRLPTSGSPSSRPWASNGKSTPTAREQWPRYSPEPFFSAPHENFAPSDFACPQKVVFNINESRKGTAGRSVEHFESISWRPT